MNLLLIYKSGYIIPFSIFYCDEFYEEDEKLVVVHDLDTIIISTWDYYDSIKLESIADEEVIVQLIKQFVSLTK